MRAAVRTCAAIMTALGVALALGSTTNVLEIGLGKLTASLRFATHPIPLVTFKSTTYLPLDGKGWLVAWVV